MLDQPEVDQFIIVPPINDRDRLVLSKERFLDFLTRRFPMYGFELASVAPVEDYAEFIVIPVMSHRSPDGDMLMCRPVRRGLLAEIAGACAEFDPRDLRLCAA